MEPQITGNSSFWAIDSSCYQKHRSPALIFLSERNPPMAGGFPTHCTRNTGLFCFYVVNRNKPLKQSITMLYEALWCSCDGTMMHKTTKTRIFVIPCIMRFAASQREKALLCNDVSHWLGASLESALQQTFTSVKLMNMSLLTDMIGCGK